MYNPSITLSTTPDGSAAGEASRASRGSGGDSQEKGADKTQWLTLLFDLFLSLVCVMAVWINMTVIQLHPGQLSRQLLPHSAYLVSRP
jgi:hypothetical protein